MRTFLRAAGGLLLGAFLGLVVTMALVVGRAHFLHAFVHSVNALWGPLGLPVAVLAPLGAVLAARRPGSLPAAAVGALAGLAVCAAVGTLAGALVGTHDTETWAGGILGAGVGALLGPAAAVALQGRRGASGAGTMVAALLLPALVPLASCGGEEGPAPAGRASQAGPEGSGEAETLRAAPATVEDTAAVDAMILLLGDPGMARTRHYPVLVSARRDVERWAAAIGPEGKVNLVVLGDMIYPDGLHPPDHRLRERDSLRLVDQIELISGPAAREAGARAWFVAGNHDWGQKEDFEGAVRLERLDRFLEQWRRETGTPVRLLPEAGTGGPAVEDVGRRLRLVFLDTAWWLLDASENPKAKADVLDGVSRALSTAGDRRVVLAAHHPFESAGPHGGLRRFTESFGVGYLLSRSGALLQGLNSPVYRELRNGLLRVSARAGRIDLFAGGHEHSLQVIGPTAPHAPLATVVSGSASKLTPVEPIEESLFVRSAPGYARLLVLDDGTLRLELVAAPRRYRRCSGSDAPECLRRGTEEFGTVWAGVLPPTEDR